MWPHNVWHSTWMLRYDWITSYVIYWINLSHPVNWKLCKCNKYEIKGWPVISGVGICYMLAISIAGLWCPEHDALTVFYTLHREVMHMSCLVFMRTYELSNQCLMVTCYKHSTPPSQSHWALPCYRYCILSYIPTPLVPSSMVNSVYSIMSVA